LAPEGCQEKLIFFEGLCPKDLFLGLFSRCPVGVSLHHVGNKIQQNTDIELVGRGLSDRQMLPVKAIGTATEPATDTDTDPDPDPDPDPTKDTTIGDTTNTATNTEL